MGTWWRVVLAVLVRPGLWAVSVGQVIRLARRGWWRRPPFLPVPDRAYLAFRMQTAYGGDPPPKYPTVDDVLTYLHWCREFPA